MPNSVMNPEAEVSVLVVDDSAVIRATIAKRIEETPGLHVVSSLANGEMAVQYVKNSPVDIVILDIEMPVMDGLTALPLILAARPDTKVIIASTLSAKNADISLRAMQMGASDYIPKPSSVRDDNVESFFRDLIARIIAFAPKSVQGAVQKQVATVAPSAAKIVSPPAPSASPPSEFNRIVYPTFSPQALAIASSTGGPQALIGLFKRLKGHLEHVPVFITQHMPPTFTKILAQHISEACGRDCHEGKEGELVAPGKIYMAPGDFHMVPQIKKTSLVITTNQGPEVNYCRPAADPMIDALVDIYGNKLLLLVLTGMGSDGSGGAQKLYERGGFVVAQDEASSVVWGMPRMVVERHLAKAVLPLNDIPDYLIKAFGGRA